MKYARSLAVATAVAGTLAGGQAALAFTAFSNADLNLRAGPGTQYDVVATTNHDDQLDVRGCLQDITWCDVSWGQIQGWASADYLDVDASAGVKTLPLASNGMEIPIVDYKAVDAVVPEVVGKVDTVNTYVEAITPPTEVSAFVSAQTVDTVHVTGEVVVGAVVPEKVPLYAVPESEYSFTNVNGQNVLVKGDSRQVVYVYK